MEFHGEHPFPGQLGHAFVILSFVAALMSATSFFLLTRAKTPDDERRLRFYGRLGFNLHSLAVIGIVVTLFAMFANQYIEYEYIHSHSNNAMPKKYLMVAFWGGQQGSLILWAFWHMVIGNVLMRTSGKWEAPAMSIFALVQVFVTSTLLGIYVLGYKIGESPFMLYRESDISIAPLWNRIPDYLQYDSLFEDGTGLNLTLQNYWMVIHPPTLFLGFASVLVPFVLALSGLWLKDFKGWLDKAIPWTFFSVGVLGLGILMGGAWAYESLNFGGFWAWDPVENASLVPWLVLVGAAHIMLMSRNRGKISYAAFLFPVLSFILVLYSTFLTRSGILGDSSVHSFTGDGMLNQLLVFMACFIWLPFHLLIGHRKVQLAFGAFAAIIFLLGIVVDYDAVLIQSGGMNLGWRGILFVLAFAGSYGFLYLGYSRWFPKEKTKDQEPIWSREFWMFVGGLLLLLSAAHIIVSTSMPVLNDILGTRIAPVADEERNRYYAEWQVPFAIAVSLLISIGMYLRYKGMPVKQLAGRIAVPYLIAAALTWLIAAVYAFGSDDLPLIALLFTASAAIAANTDYWLRMMKGKMAAAGSALAHIGFGVLLLGTVISQGKQEVISTNRDGLDIRFVSEEFNVFEEAQVYYGDTTLIGNYFISFNNRFQEANKVYYALDFFGAEQARYAKGDTVRFASGLAVALEDHTASAEFNTDMKAGRWQPIMEDRADFYSVRAWRPMVPTEKLFDLQPHVQLNDQGQSGSNEPGTKRYWNRDVFVYLRDAKLNGDPDHHHNPYTFKRPFTLNDTVRIPHYFLIPDSIYRPDSAQLVSYSLFDTDSVWTIRFRVHPLFYDKLMSRYEHGTALFIHRDTMHLPDMQEVPRFGIKLGIESMEIPSTQDSTGNTTSYPQQASFSLTVQDREYIVLKAIEFPMINLLWIGSVIMTIGTLLSVFHRYRERKRRKKA
jgi:cytochrome c-type biogenesis protein CcmF